MHKHFYSAPTPAMMEDGDFRRVCRSTGCFQRQDSKALEEKGRKSKRSRSSVRLGKDNERRLAKRYGWTKVGQLGDAVDLLGADIKVQSKATRAPVPRSLDAMGDIKGMGEVLPAYARRPLEHMDGLYPGRIPLVVFSYIHAGRPTVDFIYISKSDYGALHGDLPPFTVLDGFYVMRGEFWLDIHGREGDRG